MGKSDSRQGTETAEKFATDKIFCYNTGCTKMAMRDRLQFVHFYDTENANGER